MEEPKLEDFETYEEWEKAYDKWFDSTTAEAKISQEEE